MNSTQLYSLRQQVFQSAAPVWDGFIVLLTCTVELRQNTLSYVYRAVYMLSSFWSRLLMVVFGPSRIARRAGSPLSDRRIASIMASSPWLPSASRQLTSYFQRSYVASSFRPGVPVKRDKRGLLRSVMGCLWVWTGSASFGSSLIFSSA